MAANGAVWTLDRAMQSPIEHPNCVRSFTTIDDGKKHEMNMSIEYDDDDIFLFASLLISSLSRKTRQLRDQS